jgi:TP901-1 family phage major tail protein
MPISKGKNLLLKMGTGGAAVVVAAMRSTRFSVNGETVDITNKDSNGMRTLLDGAGVAKLSISASGLLSGNSQSTDMVSRTLARSLDSYRLEFDNGDVIEGAFQITSFEAVGDYNGEQTYSITLDSSGALTLTTVA